MTRDTDARPISLVDLPLIRRLSNKATVLDNEMAYTKDIVIPNGAVISSMLPQRGYHTLIARSDKQQVISQFRFRAESDLAYVTFIAPSVDDDDDDTVWLHVLDAMAREAGKYHAHALIAEVEENSPLFETMRTAGFAVYARQQIWRKQPGAQTLVDSKLAELVMKADVDDLTVQSLLNNTLPPLIHQIAAPPGDMTGWIYRPLERTEAFVAVSEGRHGIFLMPYIHPDMTDVTADIVCGVLGHYQKATKVPVFVCVRRYQDWMGSYLEDANFEPGPQQAVMVRHLTAGIRHPKFKTVEAGLHATTGPTKPPSGTIRYLDVGVA